jgi:3-hydroxyisobutyrate dehydrogenase
MAIGFIGLGTMGMPIAKCLRRNGFEVHGWDVSDPAMQEYGSGVESIGTLGAICNQIVTMLPEGEHVASVYEQILESDPGDGCLFVDCSTIDVDTTRKLAEIVTAAGHEFVDAPVSGGSETAANGSLSFMIGGAAAAIERALPLLEVMGSKLTRFGEAGAGQAAKACHNMICGITALGVREAFALADALGLDLDKFFRLCQGAAAQGWILENRCPVPGPSPDAPASNDYAPGFAARRFREFVQAGNADLDFSAIYRSIRK